MKTETSRHFRKRILSAVISAVIAMTYGVPNSFPINSAALTTEQTQQYDTAEFINGITETKDGYKLFAFESVSCPENIRANITSPLYHTVTAVTQQTDILTDAAEYLNDIGRSIEQQKVTVCAGDDIDFAAEKRKYEAASAELAKLADSYASIDENGIILEKNVLNVLNITADENSASLKFSDITEKFSVKGMTSNNNKKLTLLVNIDLAGRSDIGFVPDLTFNTENAQQNNKSTDTQIIVLFNLHNAAKNNTAAKFTDKFTNGHIFAPDCNISVNRINGNITANRIEATDVSDMKIFGNYDKIIQNDTVTDSEAADICSDSGTVNHDAGKAEETLYRWENEFTDEAKTITAITQNYNTAENYASQNGNGLSTAGSRNAPDTSTEPMTKKIKTDIGGRNSAGTIVIPTVMDSGITSDAFAERRTSAVSVGTIISGTAKITDKSQNDTESVSGTNTLHERSAPCRYSESSNAAFSADEPSSSDGRKSVTSTSSAYSDTAAILRKGRAIFAHKAMNGLVPEYVTSDCVPVHCTSASSFNDCKKYTVNDDATESGMITNTSLTNEGFAYALPDHTALQGYTPEYAPAGDEPANVSSDPAYDALKQKNKERKSSGIYEKNGYNLTSENLNDIYSNESARITAESNKNSNIDSADTTIERTNKINSDTASASADITNEHNLNSAEITENHTNTANVNAEDITENYRDTNNRNKAEIKVKYSNDRNIETSENKPNDHDTDYSYAAEQKIILSNLSAINSAIHTNTAKKSEESDITSESETTTASDVPQNEETTTETTASADTGITTSETTTATATDTADNISDTETDTASTTVTTSKSNVRVIRRDDDDIPVTGVTLTITGMDNEGNTILFKDNIVKTGENVKVIAGDGVEISWITGTSPMEFCLPDGYFFIHEADAPEGHNSPDDIMIIISEGEMISAGGETPETTLIILKEEVAGPEHTTGDTSYNYITTTTTSAVKKTSSEKKSSAKTPQTGVGGVETITAVFALAAAAAYVSRRKNG